MSAKQLLNWWIHYGKGENGLAEIAGSRWQREQHGPTKRKP
jgi:hypothetical protein